MNLRDEVVLAHETAQDLFVKLDHIRAVLDGEDTPFAPLSKDEDKPKPDGLSSATSFGERLRFLRSWKDLTLADLAEESGMSVNGIGKLEKGETTPRMSTTFKLARALKVPPAWLESE